MDMTNYIKGIIEDFLAKLEGKGAMPWTAKLFTVNKQSKQLDDKRAKKFTPLL